MWLCSTVQHELLRREWILLVILTVVFPHFPMCSASINSDVLGQCFSLLGTVQTSNGVPCLTSLVLLKIWVNNNERKCNNQPNPIKLLTSFCACYLLIPLCVSSDSRALPWRARRSHLLSSEGVNALKKENICLSGVYKRLEDLALPALEMGNLCLPHGELCTNCVISHTKGRSDWGICYRIAAVTQRPSTWILLKCETLIDYFRLHREP